MTCEWRPVVGFEGLYEVSSDGQIRGLDRVIINPIHGKLVRQVRRGFVMAQRTNYKGYKTVNLHKNGRAHQAIVHRVILEAFVGPGGGLQGCHNNGDPGDNRIENLRWGTTSDNVLDQVTHGTHHHARKTHCAQGHPFDEQNTLRTKRGRQCRKCNRTNMAKRRAAARLHDAKPRPSEAAS